ncbi:hypothetical protein HDU97_007831 [Phlyctochytrium planicorne]|nr:hypothetical protein HDU97_007831 [Phlyctochytrium planicorne]
MQPSQPRSWLWLLRPLRFHHCQRQQHAEKFACIRQQSSSAQAHAFPLVSTKWLANNLQKDIVPVDCSWFKPIRKRKTSFRSKRLQWQELDLTEEELMQMPDYRQLVTSGDEEVAYVDESRSGRDEFESGVGRIPAMGHRKASVLDGGLPKWIRENRPIARPALVTKNDQDHYVPNFDESVVVQYDQMLQHAVDYLYPGHSIILDCRPKERFNGIAPERISELRNGRIPGSINLDWRLLLTEEGTLQHPLDLIRLFKTRKVDLDRDLICMGHDGIKASILFLALRVLGKDTGVSLYDAGWIDWAIQQKSPVAMF